MGIKLLPNDCPTLKQIEAIVSRGVRQYFPHLLVSPFVSHTFYYLNSQIGEKGISDSFFILL